MVLRHSAAKRKEAIRCSRPGQARRRRVDAPGRGWPVERLPGPVRSSLHLLISLDMKLCCLLLLFSRPCRDPPALMQGLPSCILGVKLDKRGRPRSNRIIRSVSVAVLRPVSKGFRPPSNCPPLQVFQLDPGCGHFPKTVRGDLDAPCGRAVVAPVDKCRCSGPSDRCVCVMDASCMI